MASEILRDIGKAIAAEIRVMGHYTGVPSTNEGCCIISSPTYWDLLSRQRKREFLDALYVRLGHDIDEAEGLDVINTVIDWNDHTPTDEVCAVLESM